MVDWSFSKRKKDEEEAVRGVTRSHILLYYNGDEKKKNIFELCCNFSILLDFFF